MSKFIEITKVYKVDKCLNCPNFLKSMDGPYCSEIEKIHGAYSGLMSHEERNLINKKCPFLK